MSGIMDAFTMAMKNYGDLTNPNSLDTSQSAQQNDVNQLQAQQGKYIKANQAYSQPQQTPLQQTPVVNTTVPAQPVVPPVAPPVVAPQTAPQAVAPPTQQMADADLKEPSGDAHWTLREEDDFILAKNQRTGEMKKLLTAPLTKNETKEADAPHGAGPLGANSPDRQHTDMHDGDLEPSDFRAGPMPSYSDADLKEPDPDDVKKLGKSLYAERANTIGIKVMSALDKKFKKANK